MDDSAFLKTVVKIGVNTPIKLISIFCPVDFSRTLSALINSDFTLDLSSLKKAISEGIDFPQGFVDLNVQCDYKLCPLLTWG